MSIFNWLKNNRADNNEVLKEGICPNCWGRQEYSGKFLSLAKDKQVDINNHQASRTFIQAFVKEHLDPISLQNHDVYSVCPVCKTKYNK